MANSADPDQKPTDLDLHCLLRQHVVFSKRRVKGKTKMMKNESEMKDLDKPCI